MWMCMGVYVLCAVMVESTVLKSIFEGLVLDLLYLCTKYFHYMLFYAFTLLHFIGKYSYMKCIK